MKTLFKKYNDLESKIVRIALKVHFDISEFGHYLEEYDLFE